MKIYEIVFQTLCILAFLFGVVMLAFNAEALQVYSNLTKHETVLKYGHIDRKHK